MAIISFFESVAFFFKAVLAASVTVSGYDRCNGSVGYYDPDTTVTDRPDADPLSCQGGILIASSPRSRSRQHGGKTEMKRLGIRYDFLRADTPEAVT